MWDARQGKENGDVLKKLDDVLKLMAAGVSPPPAAAVNYQQCIQNQAHLICAEINGEKVNAQPTCV